MSESEYIALIENESHKLSFSTCDLVLIVAPSQVDCVEAPRNVALIRAPRPPKYGQFARSTEKVLGKVPRVRSEGLLR